MLKRSELIKKRFIACSQNSEITMTDELHILNYLVKKYNLTSVANYAKQQGVSITAINKRIEKGKVQYLNLAGRNMIIN